MTGERKRRLLARASDTIRLNGQGLTLASEVMRFIPSPKTRIIRLGKRYMVANGGHATRLPMAGAPQNGLHLSVARRGLVRALGRPSNAPGFAPFPFPALHHLPRLLTAQSAPRFCAAFRAPSAEVLSREDARAGKSFRPCRPVGCLHCLSARLFSHGFQSGASRRTSANVPGARSAKDSANTGGACRCLARWTESSSLPPASRRAFRPLPAPERAGGSAETAPSRRLRPAFRKRCSPFRTSFHLVFPSRELFSCPLDYHNPVTIQSLFSTFVSS